MYFAEDAGSRNVVDGLLLSRDGKVLIERLRYTGLVRVPEGVEAIADRAFYGDPLREVELPSSLKSIGAEAFAYTLIEKARIPARVEKIGCRAFLWSEERSNPYGYHSTDRPVYLDVDAENETFFSSNGSLIERLPDGGQRLRSFYYETGAKASYATKHDIRIPEGITCLGTSCIVNPGLFQTLRLHLPESLEEIEEGATPAADVSYIYIPAKLSRVAHDFWRHVAEGYPYVFDHITGEPLYEFDRGDTKVKISPLNKNYEMSRGRFYILNADEQDEGSMTPMARPSERDIALFADEVVGKIEDGARSEKFAATASVAKAEREAALMLEPGDILEIRPTAKEDEATVLFCGHKVGTIKIPAHELEYPFDVLFQDDSLLSGKGERYSFSAEVGGKEVSYTFEFFGDGSDDYEEAEFYRYADARAFVSASPIVPTSWRRTAIR